MPKMGVLPSMIGESWLPVEYTSSLPSLVLTSQDQPLPKRLAPASFIFSFKPARPPKVLLIASPTLPLGSPPALGPSTVQKSEWLACPPPLLMTAWRTFSGTFEALSARSSSIERLCRLGRSFNALLRLVTYAL